MSGSTLFVRDLMLLCPLLVASARVMTVGVVMVVVISMTVTIAAVMYVSNPLFVLHIGIFVA